MATQLQIRRGTTAQMNAFTGAEGELAVNTSTDTVHVHDGSTAGGFALAKADGSNIGTYAGSFTTLAASGAVTLSSTLAVTGEITANGGIALGDNDKATFGASDDLQIYSDGDSSYLKENSATGSLFVDGDNIRFRTSDGSKSYALFTNSGSARLYHDNSIKIETTSTGIDVTGTATMGAMNVTSGLASGTGIGAGGANGNLRLYANGAQVVTVTTTGVGIGTSSPNIANFGKALTITDPATSNQIPAIELAFGSNTRGANIAVDNRASVKALAITAVASDLAMTFGTNNTERMRLSGGNLLVGTTSASGSGASTGKQVIQFAGASENGLYLDDTRTSSGTDNAIIFGRGATYCGKIETTTAPATNYVSASDQRLKENIADADDAGSKIDAIQVRKYDWIGDGTHQEYGLVAQELQPIAPLAVSGDADSEDMMGVDYSKLVPMLIKEIQSLRTRVQTLENN